MLRARRALGEFAIGGVDTNLAFLDALLADPHVMQGDVTTHFVEDHTAQLVQASASFTPAAAVASAPVAARVVAQADVPEGTLALKFVSQHTLDAVVCDLQMSRLEGDLLHSTVERSNPSLAQRFIFITGEEEASRFEKFAESEEWPVLHKPVEVDTLVGEVVRMAERE